MSNNEFEVRADVKSEFGVDSCLHFAHVVTEAVAEIWVRHRRLSLESYPFEKTGWKFPRHESLHDIDETYLVDVISSVNRQVPHEIAYVERYSSVQSEPSLDVPILFTPFSPFPLDFGVDAVDGHIRVRISIDGDAAVRFTTDRWDELKCPDQRDIGRLAFIPLLHRSEAEAVTHETIEWHMIDHFENGDNYWLFVRHHFSYIASKLVNDPLVVSHDVLIPYDEKWGA